MTPDPQVSGILLDGVQLLETAEFRDERGWFVENWSRASLRAAGIECDFVQDNVSWSKHGVLRGMHFQRHPHEQAKLLSVLDGSIFDVAVDIRAESATFGRWFGCVLSAENHRRLFIPGGFAHGFLVLSDAALVSYKCSRVYSPGAEGSIRWDDPDAAIEWPAAPAVVSAKDRGAGLLRDLLSSAPR